MKDIEIAYAAGFFDGEGHLRVSIHSKRCRTMMLQCSAVQAEEAPLVFLQKLFGGTVSMRYINYFAFSDGKLLSPANVMISQ